MSYSRAVCEGIWSEALAVENGLAITPEDGDIKALRQDLYKARELIMDARLHTLAMHVSPDGKELWICKKPTSR